MSMIPPRISRFGSKMQPSSDVVGCFLEYHERFGAEAIEFHCVGRRFGLHDLLEGFYVGDFKDLAHPVGVRRVGEEPARYAQGAEDLLPLG
jgi:hypothetical protein